MVFSAGLLLGLFILCGVSLGIGWLYWLMTGESRSQHQWVHIREEVTITVQAPTQVAPGETFSLQLFLEHHGDRPYHLERLVLWQQAPEEDFITCRILSPPARADHWSESMLRWYWRGHTVPPGNTLAITLSCQIPTTGDYQFEVSLYLEEAPLHALVQTFDIQSQTEAP